ncbi:hypothetical protein CC78DRAFT_173494 [Lojkania enalia]|uniref:HTH La-type RNA-binding domain-containing protein n=1 Tax=Lojkania enalia TaxID=147567 RepID=A0A9P4KGM1_9PLEO|nr:hypothetical protein CC78DRAFT_173494 [Didymosphaeria enalia]
MVDANTAPPSEPQAGETTPETAIQAASDSSGPSKTTKGSTKPEKGENPDAAAIRRQVEYYFSEENLPNDLHMLQCCGGSKNLPVSISRICGFRRMRHFRPKRLVAEALRESAFLEVSPDGETVKRKVPLSIKTILDSDDSDGEIAYDPRLGRELYKPIQLLSQTKEPGRSRKMELPTGFEESYVEGPIAPAEFEEQKLLYDPEKPFLERIELAIQRFKQKRRMREPYSKVFNKWMRFGGVDCGPNMFGSISKQEMAEMNVEEITRAKATHHVPWDRSDPTQWVVDFAGVAEAFLSSYHPIHFGHDPGQLIAACQVLQSFYTFLLRHEVCPEYNDALMIARAVPKTAREEMPKVNSAANNLPGHFNVAASTIFKGYYAGTYVGDQEWAQQAQREGATWGIDEVGMRHEKANIVFSTAIAILGRNDMWNGLDPKRMTVAKKEELVLEVYRTEFATNTANKLYGEQNEHFKKKLLLDPPGKLICKSIHIPNFTQYDLPHSTCYPNGKRPSAEVGKTYVFWVEDFVLKYCVAGMKIDAQVITLDNGFTILDQVIDCHPSFYKWLPNELWMADKPREFRLKAINDIVDDEEMGIDGEGQEGKEKGSGGDSDGLSKPDLN